jgi:hypothetical protein
MPATETLTTLATDVYERLKVRSVKFREPSFSGGGVLRIEPKRGDFYGAEIECVAGGGPTPRKVQRNR